LREEIQWITTVNGNGAGSDCSGSIGRLVRQEFKRAPAKGLMLLNPSGEIERNSSTQRVKQKLA
jgi:hypothetical protein